MPPSSVHVVTPVLVIGSSSSAIRGDREGVSNVFFIENLMTLPSIPPYSSFSKPSIHGSKVEIVEPVAPTLENPNVTMSKIGPIVYASAHREGKSIVVEEEIPTYLLWGGLE